MESGFRKEFPPPLLFQAVPFSILGGAFWTVANTTCPLSSWQHFSCDFQSSGGVYSQCGSASLFFLYCGFSPCSWSSPTAPSGTAGLSLCLAFCRWVDCTNWRDKLEELPRGLNPGILSALVVQGSTSISLEGLRAARLLLGSVPLTSTIHLRRMTPGWSRACTSCRLELYLS